MEINSALFLYTPLDYEYHSKFWQYHFFESAKASHAMSHSISPLHFCIALLLALTTLAFANPMVLSRATPPDNPGPKKRGVAYNREEYVQYFNIPDGQIGWAYNWDQLTKPTNTPFEYVAMLWDNSEGSVSRWNEAVTRSALAQPDDPTHLLGFNEPDNCE